MKINGQRIGYLLGRACNTTNRIINQPYEGETAERLFRRLHVANMRTMDRHAPCEPMTVAIVMEAFEESMRQSIDDEPSLQNLVCRKYLEFLEGDFRVQMTEKYAIQYPLNFDVKDIESK